MTTLYSRPLIVVLASSVALAEWLIAKISSLKTLEVDAGMVLRRYRVVANLSPHIFSGSPLLRRMPMS